MLNVEFINQFASFGAILAGFSMSIAYSFFLHIDDTNEAKHTLLQFIGGAFLASAVFLILGVFLASLVLSVHSANGSPDPPTPTVLRGANWVFTLTLIGAASMLIGIGSSGFIRTDRLGAFSIIVAVVGAIGSVIIYLTLM